MSANPRDARVAQDRHPPQARCRSTSGRRRVVDLILCQLHADHPCPRDHRARSPPGAARRSRGSGSNSEDAAGEVANRLEDEVVAHRTSPARHRPPRESGRADNMCRSPAGPPRDDGRLSAPSPRAESTFHCDVTVDLFHVCLLLSLTLTALSGFLLPSELPQIRGASVAENTKEHEGQKDTKRNEGNDLEPSPTISEIFRVLWSFVSLAFLKNTARVLRSRVRSHFADSFHLRCLELYASE